MASFKKWLVASVATLVVVASSNAVSAACLDDIKSKGVLKVGNGIMGLKPYVYQKEGGGGLTGFEYEMLQELTKRLGLKYEYVTSDWTSLIPGLKSSRWDVIMSGMTVTQERIQGAGIEFSLPYLIQYDVVVTRSDSGLKSMDDLKTEMVAASIGTVESINAHIMASKGMIGGAVDFNAIVDPFLALNKKQVNAIITDQITYNAQKATMPNLVVIGGPFPYQPKPGWEEQEAKSKFVTGAAAVGIRRECPDLLAAVNKALAEMNADGTRQRIYEAYGIWDETQAKVTK